MDNGMIYAYRKIGDFDSTEIQVALLDQNGKFLLDWSNVKEFEGYPEDNENYYNAPKFEYVGDTMFYHRLSNNKSMLMNILEKKVYLFDTIGYPNRLSKYHNGYMVIEDRSIVCTVSKTGEVSVVEGVNGDYLSFIGENTFYDSLNDCFYNETLSNKTPINASNIYYCSDFINNKALIVLSGDSNRDYFTLIDRNGNILFEPIYHPCYKGKKNPNIFWDGKNIMKFDSSVYTLQSSETAYKLVSFYDELGNKNKDVDVEGVFKPGAKVLDNFSEGFVTVRMTINKDKNYCYLKPDGTVLFENCRITGTYK